jgi:hypothetical protein
MKIAIMQPYFFPYLGYWQLINAVDRFIIFDDVNFIKGGWINRNRILVNGKPTYVTIALRDASQNKRICCIEVHTVAFRRDRILKTITHSYNRSPYFDQVYPALETIFLNPEINLSRFLEFGIRTVCSLLGIQTHIASSHDTYDNEELKGQSRILDICVQEGADVYVNAPGGSKLYDADKFAEAGVDLKFLLMRHKPYHQQAMDFKPFMSVIDPLMEIGVEGVRLKLAEYDLVSTGDLNAL